MVTSAESAAEESLPRREVGTLIYDGIPEIPPHLRGELQRYRNARAAVFQDWSADGSMLIATRFGETSQVHRVASPGAARTQLTFFDEPVSGVRTIPGSDRFVYLRDAGGAEYYQIFLAGPGGSETAISEAKTRNETPVFSKDGKFLLWSQVRPGEPDYDVIAADVDDLANRRVVFEGTGAFGVLDISADGSKALLDKYLSIQESQLWLLDLTSGEAKQIREGQPPGSYAGGKFARDGRSIVTTSDENAEARRLIEIDLESEETTPLTEASAWDVEDFDVSSDGRLLAWSVNEDGYSRVFLRDLVTGRDLPQPELPPGVLVTLKFSPDGKRLAVNLTGPLTPGDVWTWEIEQGELIRWTASEPGPLDPATFVAPELVRYPSFDGLMIPAFVYRAKQEGPRPVIVEIHGGPEGQSRPTFDPRVLYWMNELGASVVVPNVRGSSGYGKKWLSLDNGPLRQNSVQDIGALLDWIETQPDLDSSRVVVYGASYGGFMTLASLAAYSDRLAGAVDIVGISNFTTFLTNTEGYRRDLRRAEYGDERDPEMHAIFDRISPSNLTDRMKKPLLVIQGANDPRVPQSEAEQIVTKVRAEGEPVWYLLATDEGHGFRKKRNVDAQREVETMFLRMALRVKPAAAP
ncbi:MAG TPA: S9 family peptidase [Pirellulaceae bacterium]|jgi:dipeptidyl aminopeptidase/acylaminoacyl peptidase|nr:S9 family peptidase [Pirellulaceae bacterium]